MKSRQNKIFSWCFSPKSIKTCLLRPVDVEPRLSSKEPFEASSLRPREKQQLAYKVTWRPAPLRGPGLLAANTHERLLVQRVPPAQPRSPLSRMGGTESEVLQQGHVC